MKFRPLACLAVAALAATLLGISAPARAGTFTAVDRGPLTFPNAGPTAASRFPAELDVFGASSAVTDVNVRLGDLSHTFPADLDIELVGPDGTAVPLMSDLCSAGDISHATLFFDDEAGSTLPVNPQESCGSGIFRPGNDDDSDDWAVDPTATTLSAFDGTNPDGTWRLFVQDDGLEDTGEIGAGWALQITTASDGTLAVPGPGTGGSGPATVYPLELPVSGRSGAITDVDLTLPGLSHFFPDDLDVLLVSPSGRSVLVMARACGSGDVDDVTLTFDDEAAEHLPDQASCDSGSFRPTSFAPESETLPEPAPDPPYAERLSAFDGSEANGTWRLFVLDGDDEDGGFLAGRPQLTITTTDVVAPDTQLTRRPHSSARRTALVTFAASEAGSGFECQVDGKQFASCSSPLRLKHLRAGKHRVAVRAVDAAGNVDPTPAVVRWRVRRG